MIVYSCSSRTGGDAAKKTCFAKSAIAPLRDVHLL